MPYESDLEWESVGASPLGRSWTQGDRMGLQEELGRGRRFAMGSSRPRTIRTPPRYGRRGPFVKRRPPYVVGLWPRWGIAVEPFPAIGPEEPYPVEPEPGDTEDVRWAQDCLNRALGLGLPVSGMLDAATRSGIRSFQRQQGLAINGLPDAPTRRRLAIACGRASANDKSTASEGDLEGYEEVLSGNREEWSDRELRITGHYTVQLEPRPTPRSFNDMVSGDGKISADMPNKAGIYFIYKGAVLNYVGKANKIRDRFYTRLGAFRELGISPSTYKDWLARNDVKVTWHLFPSTIAKPERAKFEEPERRNRRTKQVTSWKTKEISPESALLRAVESYFITKDGKPPGNDAPERIHFAGTQGSLTIEIAGANPPKVALHSSYG